jgi:sirohydrochlorin ferrochelatase
MKKSVLIAGHGSKLKGANKPINLLVEALQKKEKPIFFIAAFLEIASPTIPEGIEICIKQGAEEIVVMPYFVQAGKHVMEDIPNLVQNARQKYSNKTILLADYLGFDERLVSLVSSRIEEARLCQ